MKIIFECNEQEAKDMLELKAQFEQYKVQEVIENNQEEEEPVKRRIGF